MTAKAEIQPGSSSVYSYVTTLLYCIAQLTRTSMAGGTDEKHTDALDSARNTNMCMFPSTCRGWRLATAKTAGEDEPPL
jgi:hypothetical protein